MSTQFYSSRTSSIFDSVKSPLLSSTFSLVSQSNSIYGEKSTINQNLNIRYDNLNATAISVESIGSYGVLAGRKGLYIIDLDSPYQPSRVLHHQSQWEVAVVKFNPHPEQKGYIASTSNRNTLIWNIGENGTASHPLYATLRAHTRPVGDISWSSEPSILATCSAGMRTYVWDLRTPRKPIQTLSASSTGTGLVKWNLNNQGILATTHDGYVRIWDTRSVENGPLTIVTAHMQQIYGIDWSPVRCNEFVTCSEDQSLKIFDINDPMNCLGHLSTGAPIWKARYTPFGDGLVTISHRVDNTIRLWSLSTEESSISIEKVHAFSGGTSFVKGFDWRVKTNENSFQLICWTNDQELRTYSMVPQFLQACGHCLVDQPERKNIEIPTILPTYLPSQSKYDLSYLKNDIVPLTIPLNATPLTLQNYSTLEPFQELFHNDFLLLIHQDDSLTKKKTPSILIQKTLNFDQKENLNDSSLSNISSSHLNQSSLEYLPCPRISGGCFSGGNCLIIFNSKAALGHHHTILPKTYLGLLSINRRDSETRYQRRLSTPLRKASDQSQTFINDFEEHPSSFDDYEDSFSFGNGRRRHEESITEEDMSLSSSGVMDSSDYLTSYFSDSRLHLPINNPEHAVTVSPETLAKSQIHHHSVSNSYSLNVILLDLSILCRSSSILAHAYCYSFPCDPIKILSKKQDTPKSKDRLDFLLKSIHIKSNQQEEKENGVGCLKKSSSSSALDEQYYLNHSQEISSCSTYRWIDDMSLNPPKRKNSSFIHRNQEKEMFSSHTTTKSDQESIDSLSFDHEKKEKEKKKNEKRKGNISSICQYNAQVALQHGHVDLNHLWNLLELMTDKRVSHQSSSSSLKEILHPWKYHPMGSFLLNKLFYIQEQHGDVQTLAMMVHVLGKQTPDHHHPDQDDDDDDHHHHQDDTKPQTCEKKIESRWKNKNLQKKKKSKQKTNMKQILKELNTIIPYNNSKKKDLTISSSFYTSLSNNQMNKEKQKKNKNEQKDDDDNNISINCLLDMNVNAQHRYQCYKENYGDLLYRWGLSETRIKIKKSFPILQQSIESIGFIINCYSCQQPINGIYCLSCHDFAIKCSICQLVVRGQSMFCMTCGHGGHVDHLQIWFQTYDLCPTGCGCFCKLATACGENKEISNIISS